MKVFAVVLLLTLVCQVYSKCTILPKKSCRLDRAATTSRRFSYKLFRHASNETSNDKNVFMSPFNVGMALTMLLPGARGQSWEDLITTLNWRHTIQKFDKIDIPCLYEFYNEATLQSSSGNITLRTANRVYTDNMLPLNEEVFDEVRKYGASLEKTDFVHGHEESRLAINNWVSEQTEGKIDELFAENDINPSTKMALTSAIYFKGEWETQFDVTEEKEEFMVSDEESVMVEFLERSGDFKWLKTDEHMFVEIPYKSNTNGNCMDVSMILLKRTDGNMKKMQSMLQDSNMREHLESLYLERAYPARVKFPKFSINSEYSLKEILSKMGMARLFDPLLADLMNFVHKDNRATTPNLSVDKVVHKAFIDVNEEGTEAAAATGLTVSARSFFFRPPEFLFNTPFCFFIYDRSRDTILFLGRMSNPASETK